MSPGLVPATADTAVVTRRPPWRGLLAWIGGERATSVPYYLLAPTLLFLIVIVLVPFVLSVYVSLTELNQYTIAHWLQAPFVGLAHYVDALTQPGAVSASFPESIWASVSFSVLTTVAIVPIAIVAALMMDGDFPGRGFFRSLFLIPYVIPSFVNAIVWRLIFLNNYGLADRVLPLAHLGNRTDFWLIGPRTFWAMVIADVWASWPFVYLLVLAALQAVPSDVEDAAEIDGAGGLARFFDITLPLIRPTLTLAILLSTIFHFNNFTLPFVMFGTPPPAAVDVLPLTVLINSFQIFNFGLGAAMSVLTLLIMMIPATLYMRLVHLGGLE
ncbi:MAG: carbohydrate ABC transporter permease [Chloroflexota bacterium]